MVQSAPLQDASARESWLCAAIRTSPRTIVSGAGSAPGPDGPPFEAVPPPLPPPPHAASNKVARAPEIRIPTGMPSLCLPGAKNCPLPDSSSSIQLLPDKAGSPVQQLSAELGRAGDGRSKAFSGRSCPPAGNDPGHAELVQQKLELLVRPDVARQDEVPAVGGARREMLNRAGGHAGSRQSQRLVSRAPGGMGRLVTAELVMRSGCRVVM